MEMEILEEPQYLLQFIYNLFAIYHNLLHSIYIIYDSYCNNTLFKNNSNYVKQHILFV